MGSLGVNTLLCVSLFISAACSSRSTMPVPGENGTFFQTVPMVRRSLDSASSLIVGGDSLEVFADFAPMRSTPTLRLSHSLIADALIPIYAGRAGDSARTISPEQGAGRIVVFMAPLGANGRPTGVYSAIAADILARFPTAAAIAKVIGATRRSSELGAAIDAVNARRDEPYLIDYSFDAPRHPLNRFCRSDSIRSIGPSVLVDIYPEIGVTIIDWKSKGARSSTG